MNRAALKGSGMAGKINPDSAKARLVELVIGCPRNDYSEHCQLYEKRLLPLAEKLDWLLSLPDDELVNIYNTHCECLEAKGELSQVGNSRLSHG
jgi:hypothetical protein